MCGIAGIISSQGVNRALVEVMIEPLQHRGPDAAGVWIDNAAGVGLGHRRLAIVDLSACGSQPMFSHSGKLVIAYNGEIYNHRELRRRLDEQRPGIAWRGHSDTETLLECIETWGLRDTLERCVGMFAIALWDRNVGRLSLARDRFGEKPLYLGWAGRDFVFASELKALRSLPTFDNDINLDALRLFAARAYVPAPLSIYRGIFKLPPGTLLELTPEAALRRSDSPPGEHSSPLKTERYWDYRTVVESGLATPFSSEREAEEALDLALRDAVTGQAMADVPVGAFLSGGIDSSTVVAYYQKYSATPVRTFTIGFDDPAYDEASYARAVAQHLQTDHSELYVSAEQARDTIPLMPRVYDEPFADSSQVPTFLLSQFARGTVKVALSGDGGDELFGGYNRYFGAARLWSHMKRMPHPMRSFTGRSFSQVSPNAWNRVANLMPGTKVPPHFGTKVQKAFRTMGKASSIDDVFVTFLDEWNGTASPVLGGRDEPACAFDLAVDAPDAVRMMYCDAGSYLPDDILCKVDRAAMAVSLETRVPFLDHRLAAVAARMPLDMKIRGGEGKRILRQLLYRHAPESLFKRPKAGFGMPLGSWLRGPLRPWAESLLDERRLREGGYFDAGLVRRRWAEHLAGTRDAGPTIWAILTFEEWRLGTLSEERVKVPAE